MIVSHSSVLSKRRVADTICSENQNNILFSVKLFFENHAVHEITWKDIVKSDRPQVTIRRMRTACWIPKSTNTHRVYNDYCITTASLHERTST
jgi:hypothetical protein